MGVEYIVQHGDHASRIAAKFGFLDFSTIFDDPANKELKEKRKNPHVLLPGDVVAIPDKQVKEVDAATTKRHRFVASAITLQLRLKFIDYPQKPLAGKECAVKVDAASETITTDGDGKIETDILPDSKIAKVTILSLDFSAEIGGLDPVDTDSGVEARLNNLGYAVAPEDDRDEDELKSALEEFQCDQKIDITGENDDATQGKILEIHGS